MDAGGRGRRGAGRAARRARRACVPARHSSPSSTTLQPKVKASRCLTKYHWRTAEQAAGAAGAGAGASGAPEMVASQVVSDFLVPGFGLEPPAAALQAGGQPHTVYTYRMAFRRHASEETQGAEAAAAAAAEAVPLGNSLA